MLAGYSTAVLLDDTVDALRSARMLGVALPDPAAAFARSDAADPAVLRPELERAWRELAAAVRVAVSRDADGADRADRSDAADPADPADPADRAETSLRLVAVLERVGALREAAHREDVARRDRRLRGVRDALAELRHADGLAVLERDAAAALTHLGFDRGIVSRLDDGVWFPQQVVVERDPVWADDILGAAQASPRTLTHELPEATLVRRGGSILVDRVQTRDDVYTVLARTSRSSLYAAGRIPGPDRALGFLHGDRYYRGDAPVAADRVALEAFAEGLGQAVVRLRTLERTRAVVERVRALGASLPGAEGDGTGTAHPFDGLRSRVRGGEHGGGDGRAPAGEAGDGAEGAAPGTTLARLTPREREVLACVAAGGTNYSIARRLGVSEGTVKTHVKNILHKLEVANRAQAVARWWDPNPG